MAKNPKKKVRNKTMRLVTVNLQNSSSGKKVVPVQIQKGDLKNTHPQRGITGFIKYRNQYKD